MAQYLRKIKAPISIFPRIMREIQAKFNTHVNVRYTQYAGEQYGVVSFLSPVPALVLGQSAIAIERRTAAADATAAIKALVYASDLDLKGEITISITNVTLTTSGAYTAVATITDRWGGTATLDVDVNVVDTLAPVITATNDSISYAEIASWDNDTMSALDNISEDVTSSVVKAYYDADDVVLTTNTLAGFRTYLDNSGAGGVHGHVHYTLTDADGNVATPKSITVTAEYKPVITVTDSTVDLLYADVDTWDNDEMSATGVANEDVTDDVVITYFEADGTTPVATLVAFRTYIKNGTAGGLAGVVKYNYTGATQVSITVTSAAQV